MHYSTLLLHICIIYICPCVLLEHVVFWVFFLTISFSIFVHFRGCSFVQKAQHVERAGGKAVLIADNAEDNDSQYLDMITDGSSAKPSIPALFLLGRDGWETETSSHSDLCKHKLTNNDFIFYVLQDDDQKVSSKTGTSLGGHFHSCQCFVFGLVPT